MAIAVPNDVWKNECPDLGFRECGCEDLFVDVVLRGGTIADPRVGGGGLRLRLTGAGGVSGVAACCMDLLCRRVVTFHD